MGNRPNSRNSNPDTNDVSGAPGGGRFLDWRLLVGLVSIFSGIFVGSRTIATQDDIADTEERINGVISTLSDRQKNLLSQQEIKSSEAHAKIEQKIYTLQEDLRRREETSFRIRDADSLKEWIRSEHERIKEHIHRKGNTDG